MPSCEGGVHEKTQQVRKLKRRSLRYGRRTRTEQFMDINREECVQKEEVTSCSQCCDMSPKVRRKRNGRWVGKHGGQQRGGHWDHCLEFGRWKLDAVWWGEKELGSLFSKHRPCFQGDWHWPGSRLEEGMKSKEVFFQDGSYQNVCPVNREKGERFMGKGKVLVVRKPGIQTPSDGADLW